MQKKALEYCGPVTRGRLICLRLIMEGKVNRKKSEMLTLNSQQEFRF